MLINLVFQVLMAMVKMVPTTWTETNRALHIIKTRRVTEEICLLKSFQVLGEGAEFKIPIPRSYPLSLHSFQIPLNHIPVGERLRFFLREWEKITTDQFVLKIIAEGYRIEFSRIPQLTSQISYTSLPENPLKAQALIEEINSLLEKGAII